MILSLSQSKILNIIFLIIISFHLVHAPLVGAKSSNSSSFNCAKNEEKDLKKTIHNELKKKDSNFRGLAFKFLSDKKGTDEDTESNKILEIILKFWSVFDLIYLLWAWSSVNTYIPKQCAISVRINFSVWLLYFFSKIYVFGNHLGQLMTMNPPPGKIKTTKQAYSYLLKVYDTQINYEEQNLYIYKSTLAALSIVLIFCLMEELQGGLFAIDCPQFKKEIKCEAKASKKLSTEGMKKFFKTNKWFLFALPVFIAAVVMKIPSLNKMSTISENMSWQTINSLKIIRLIPLLLKSLSDMQNDQKVIAVTSKICEHKKLWAGTPFYRLTNYLYNIIFTVIAIYITMMKRRVIDNRKACLENLQSELNENNITFKKLIDKCLSVSWANDQGRNNPPTVALHKISQICINKTGIFDVGCSCIQSNDCMQLKATKKMVMKTLKLFPENGKIIFKNISSFNQFANNRKNMLELHPIDKMNFANQAYNIIENMAKEPKVNRPNLIRDFFAKRNKILFNPKLLSSLDHYNKKLAGINLLRSETHSIPETESINLVTKKHAKILKPLRMKIKTRPSPTTPTKKYKILTINKNPLKSLWKIISNRHVIIFFNKN